MNIDYLEYDDVIIMSKEFIYLRVNDLLDEINDILIKFKCI